MVKFFRKNAVAITWVIVISFAATMFGGSLFLKRLYKNDSAGNGPKKAQDFSAEIAVIDDLPVNKRFFYNYLNELKNLYKNKNKTERIGPENQEYLLFLALKESIQYTLFYSGAKAEKLKIEKAELLGQLESIYKAYNIKGKKELIELLKKYKYPYTKFIEDLKEEILAKKFVSLLTKDITVSDKDVENSNYQIKVQHILIKIDTPTSNKEIKQEKYADEAKAKIANIREKIIEGMPFADAAKKYSDDFISKGSGGELDWFTINNMVPEFENTAFALEVGEMSMPVQTRFGFHLIKLVDKKRITTKKFDFEERRKEILQTRKNQIVGQYINSKLGNLKLFEPSLMAIDSKQKNDWESAINSYQTLISRYPQNPVPHYLLSQVYLNKKTSIYDLDKATKELNKALIKAELSPEEDFTELHILKGKLFKEQKKKSDMLKEFDRAVELAKNDRITLVALQKIFKENKLTERTRKLEIDIKRLEEELKAKQELVSSKNSTAQNK